MRRTGAEQAVSRCDRGDLLRQIDHGLGDDALRGRVRHADDLLVDGLGKVCRQGVAQSRHRQPGGCIEQARAILPEEVGAGAVHHDRPRITARVPVQHQARGLLGHGGLPQPKRACLSCDIVHDRVPLQGCLDEEHTEPSE